MCFPKQPKIDTTPVETTSAVADTAVAANTATEVKTKEPMKRKGKGQLVIDVGSSGGSGLNIPL